VCLLLSKYLKISANLAKYIPKFMKIKDEELHLPEKNYCDLSQVVQYL